MEHGGLKLFLTSFTILVVGGGLGYFYIHEQAPVCGVELAREGVVKECGCWGWEVELENSVESGGVRRSVCVGVLRGSRCFEPHAVGMVEVECE